MRMGREAKIWRDEKLHGNDLLNEEIMARLKELAVLVSIVSSRYLQSEWCTREAREFCEHAERNGGLTVGSKLRVFKVIKTPVEYPGAASGADQGCARLRVFHLQGRRAARIR